MAPMKTITLTDLKGVVRARVTEASSLRQCARDLGLTAATISSLLCHAKRKPGPKVLRALGYERVERYQRTVK